MNCQIEINFHGRRTVRHCCPLVAVAVAVVAAASGMEAILTIVYIYEVGAAAIVVAGERATNELVGAKKQQAVALELQQFH